MKKMKLMLRLSIASCLLISVLGAPSLEASAVISPLKQYVMTEDGYRNMRLSVDKPIAGALNNVPENAIIEFYINEICVGTLTLSQLKNSQESRIAINDSIPIGIYEEDIYEKTIDETNIRVAYQIIDKKNNKTYKGNSYPLNKDKDYYEEMKFITGYKSKKTFIEAIRLNISKASREEGGILIAIASYKRNSFSAVTPTKINDASIVSIEPEGSAFHRTDIMKTIVKEYEKETGINRKPQIIKNMDVVNQARIWYPDSYENPAAPYILRNYIFGLRRGGMDKETIKQGLQKIIDSMHHENIIIEDELSGLLKQGMEAVSCPLPKGELSFGAIGSSAPSSPSALAERRIVEEDDAQPGAPPSPVSGARATATPSK